MSWPDIDAVLRPPLIALLGNGNAVLIAAGLMLALCGCWRLTRPRVQDRHRRGALLVDGRAMQRRTARRNRAEIRAVSLAGVAIASGDETKHFKLIGTTGTGKSTAIRELLGAALARGDRAVFADPD